VKVLHQLRAPVIRGRRSSVLGMSGTAIQHKPRHPFPTVGGDPNQIRPLLELPNADSKLELDVGVGFEDLPCAIVEYVGWKMIVREPRGGSNHLSRRVSYAPLSPPMGHAVLERIRQHVPETPCTVVLVFGAWLQQQDAQAACQPGAGKLDGARQARGSRAGNDDVSFRIAQRVLRSPGRPRTRRRALTLGDQRRRCPAPTPSADSARSRASSIKASCSGE
jgi:hypothetical protein